MMMVRILISLISMAALAMMLLAMTISGAVVMKARQGCMHISSASEEQENSGSKFPLHLM